MSTGVTIKQLSQLQKMSDAEFAEVLITMASITLPAGGVATGFFARMAQTRVGAKLASSSVYLRPFIISMLGAMLSEAARSDSVKEGILSFIFTVTGLELETLDVEGAKKAIGKFMADKVNEKYGTTFTPFYPPENIVDDIRVQLMSELLAAVE